MPSDMNTRKIHALTTGADEERTRLHKALVLHVSDPAKFVAKKIGSSHRTVEADRVATPKSWSRLIAYCRHSPGFALEVAIEMGLEFDRDRQAYSEFLSLQRRLLGR